MQLSVLHMLNVKKKQDGKILCWIEFCEKSSTIQELIITPTILSVSLTHRDICVDSVFFAIFAYKPTTQFINTS